MIPLVGATLGSGIGVLGGALVGETLGAVSGHNTVEEARLVFGQEMGVSGEAAVFVAGKRAGQFAGAMLGGFGGTTTGAAVGVIINNRKN